MPVPDGAPVLVVVSVVQEMKEGREVCQVRVELGCGFYLGNGYTLRG